MAPRDHPSLLNDSSDDEPDNRGREDDERTKALELRLIQEVVGRDPEKRQQIYELVTNYIRMMEICNQQRQALLGPQQHFGGGH